MFVPSWYLGLRGRARLVVEQPPRRVVPSPVLLLALCHLALAFVRYSPGTRQVLLFFLPSQSSRSGLTSLLASLMVRLPGFAFAAVVCLCCCCCLLFIASVKGWWVAKRRQTQALGVRREERRRLRRGSQISFKFHIQAHIWEK